MPDEEIKNQSKPYKQMQPRLPSNCKHWLPPESGGKMAISGLMHMVNPQLDLRNKWPNPGRSQE